MLNLKEIYTTAINESKSKYLYENGDITFKDLRDILMDVFSNGSTILQKKVPGMNILVTYKDGDFCIASDSNNLDKPCCNSKITDKFCNAGKNVKVAFMNTIHDLIDALKTLDPVLLNKYFANGQNYMDCQLVYPPEECVGNYNNKCFIVFNKLKCYDKNFKEIGEDAESANNLFGELRNNSSLCHEVQEISEPHIGKLKNCTSSKKVLDKILAKLNEFINGVGWGCSVNSYIQDKYSRYIINKALEYGLDVSRNSSFVNELVSRMSGTKMKPTKSDLVTFAKREGLNCGSDEYKNFISDIESDGKEKSAEIIQPIEDLIYYAVCMAMNNILGYLAIDPNVKTQKFLDGIDGSCYGLSEGETEYKYCKDKLDSIRKNLSKVNQYIEDYQYYPKDGVVIMYKSNPYKVVSKLGKLNRLCKLVGC